MSAHETDAAPAAGAASRGEKPPRNWTAVIIVAIVLASILSAVLLPLANHSLEKSEPVKAFLRHHFAQVRKDPAAFTTPAGERPDAERVAAYEAIARSTGEEMPWLPSVIGSELTRNLFCLEVPLRGAKEERVSVIVVQTWSEDRSSSSMKITALSASRTCECGENIQLGCILN